MITARDVRFRRPGGPEIVFPDFELAAGEQCLVHGPSGCGKTTLLHLLCGLSLASSGTLEVDGCDPAALPPAKRDAWRGRRIGLVLQQPHLLPGLTVRQNLQAARYCAGLRARDAQVDEALAALDVAHLAARPVHALSQGQAQRVAVARAVVNAPVLILADEPTSSLDDDNAAAVHGLLQESAERNGAALIVVSHDARLKQRMPRRLEMAALSRVAA